jgi:sensor histidine kinase YesM
MAARLPRLSFTTELAPAMRGLPFPPLMLISLVENAVKHGVEPKIGAVRIEVAARRLDDGRIEVEVRDDGAGFGASGGGSGIGLANVRERLRQMHGDRAALVLRARPEGGVAASITVPVE